MQNLKFGTNSNPERSKTKCNVFSKKTVYARPLYILLNNGQLPWVNQVNHLGHVLQCDNSMRIDIARKRGVFIGKMNLLSVLDWAQPALAGQLGATQWQ